MRAALTFRAAGAVSIGNVHVALEAVVACAGEFKIIIIYTFHSCSGFGFARQKRAYPTQQTPKKANGRETYKDPKIRRRASLRAFVRVDHHKQRATATYLVASSSHLGARALQCPHHGAA